MQPNFPHTEVKNVTSWSNYTGTISGRPIPIYCTPEGGRDESILRKHGDAVSSILRYCCEQAEPLRLTTIGSAWSLSRIVEPGQVVLDPANMNFMQSIPANLRTAEYLNGSGAGKTPIFIEGGTQINAINRRLATDLGLALQTSGAGDGHRIAGAIATGTHGSALRIGALHDTVLGLYLIVGPERAVFVQSGSSPFAREGIAQWLTSMTGIATDLLSDDAAFNAARVALGSLGLVFGVVVETVPLYNLSFRSFARPWNDAALWDAIRTLDTRPLHPDISEPPYHFDVVMHPYPVDNGPSLFATLMWKTASDSGSVVPPLPAVPLASSDLMGLIASAAQDLSSLGLGRLALPVVQSLISKQLAARGTSIQGAHPPGQIFGPTTLPPGTGCSTEIVVDHQFAVNALSAIYSVLESQISQGRLLLGCIGVRFVPATSAHLGTNVSAMNCYIELPSIRNESVLELYQVIWDTLESEEIPYACHWGQLSGMNPARLGRYFGDRASAWKRARAQLLTAPDGDAIALRVFQSPTIADVGLV